MRKLSSLVFLPGGLRWLATPLVTLALLAATNAVRAQSFGAVATYATGGSYSNFVATGDLNGDNRPDILVSNTSSNNIGVLLQQANGSFAPVVIYSTGGTSTQQAALGDVNGDGRLDAVVANFDSNNVSVLLGTGTGTLGTARLYALPTGANPFGLSLADINKDGRLDIVTGNSYYGGNATTGSVSILLNSATGTFGAPTSYVTGGSLRCLALADFNKDGTLDIACTSAHTPSTNGTGSVYVLLSQGSSYASAVRYQTNSRSYLIDKGDLNRDGQPDLVFDLAENAGIGVLIGKAGGGFSPMASYTVNSTFPTGVALGDVTGDSQLDVVVGNQSASTADVLSGTGTGSFSTTTSFGSGGTPYTTLLTDMNGDGKLDIVTANTSTTGNTSTSTVGVLLNTAVYTAPTLAVISPASGMVGTNVTLTGSNLLGVMSVSFNGTAATAFTVVNATTITATVPVGATTGNVTVTTPGGPSNGLLFTVTYPDLVVNTTTTIPAGTYNSITVNSPGVATLAGNVTVNTSTTVSSGATLNDGCFVLSGAGNFTLAAGSTLGICNAAGISSSGATGAIQNTGTRSFSTDASYVYNGTAAQVTGAGLPSQVRNLSSTNANTVTLSQALAIRQVLTLNNGNVDPSGQRLTLLSDASGTALIANLGTGQVPGNTVVVQRYIDPTLNPGLGYRHLAAPVAVVTVNSFGSGGTTPVVNGTYNTSAQPGTVTPFPTIFSYDQSRLATSPATTLSPFDKGWVSPTSLSQNANLALTGFTVMLPGASTLSFTGQVASGSGGAGSISLNRASGATAADAGLNLIGNPYPSPLDLGTITAGQRTNVDAAFYVFESTSQYGGNYRSYVNGVASTGGSSLIGTAQAFFVRVTAGQTSGALALTNANRVTSYGQQVAVRRTAETRPLVRLELQGASGPADSFTAYAEAGATAGFDGEYDATKLPNPTGLNLSSATATDELAIDGRAAFTPATVLALTVGVPAAGTYTLTAASLANLPAGLTPTLRDAATGQLTPLTAGTSYRFSVTATEATALLRNRFTLLFSPATALAATASLTASAVSVYPNPAQGRFTVRVPAVAAANTVQAELLNALGQVVRRQSAALPAAGATLAVETTGLAAGVYTLRLTAGASTLAKRVVLQ